MDTVSFPLNKGRFFFLLLGALVFVGIGVVMVFPSAFALEDLGSGLFRTALPYLGWLTIIFFGACFLFGLRKLFDTRPGVQITAEGLVDYSSAGAVGLIPWTNIKGMKRTEVGGQHFLTILLHHPEQIIERAGALARVSMKMNLALYHSPVQIQPKMLKQKDHDFVEVLEKAFKDRGKEVL